MFCRCLKVTKSRMTCSMRSSLRPALAALAVCDEPVKTEHLPFHLLESRDALWSDRFTFGFANHH